MSNLNSDLEEKFEDVAEEAIQKAETIKCSLEQYRAGLKIMVKALSNREQQVGDELRGGSGDRTEDDE